MYIKLKFKILNCNLLQLLHCDMIMEYKKKDSGTISIAFFSDVALLLEPIISRAIKYIKYKAEEKVRRKRKKNRR